MKHLTRREFFRRFTHEITDRVDVPAAKLEVSRAFGRDSGFPPSFHEVWHRVGRWADFTPGTRLSVQIESGSGMVSLELCSDEVGVCAVTSAGDTIALKSEGGALLACTEVKWRVGSRLSHATGDRVQRTMVDEEKIHE